VTTSGRHQFGIWHQADVVVRQLAANNHRSWELLEPLVFERPDTGGLIEVPTGMVTDHASVPRLLWAKYPPVGQWSAAAIVHDHLCNLHKAGEPHPAARTRRDADLVLWLAMRAHGVRRVDATIMWSSVRCAARLMGWDREGYALKDGRL
jgi:hypothetical protein